MSLSLESSVISKIEKLSPHPLKECAPGFRIQAYHKGHLQLNLSWGETWDYYDLASMTKQIFTVSGILSLLEQKKIKLDQSVSEILWWWQLPDVTVRALLNQTSGLVWWRSFYKKLIDAPYNDHESQWHELKSLLMRERLKHPGVCVYSDLGFLTLGCILEELSNKSLDQIWRDIRIQLGIPGIHFNKNHQLVYRKEAYAPTEKCPWRKKILQGEVHDDNCWALGGVSSHAGLFGSIDDVSQWALKIRSVFLGRESHQYLPETWLKKFVARSLPEESGDWGLGFWSKSKKGSSAGKNFSARSFGCLGFTGTSVWFDPQIDGFIVILSNRVHPTRDNPRFGLLRPLIHDVIYDDVFKRG